jgi:hypothetical protein
VGERGLHRIGRWDGAVTLLADGDGGDGELGRGIDGAGEEAGRGAMVRDLHVRGAVDDGGCAGVVEVDGVDL